MICTKACVPLVRGFLVDPGFLWRSVPQGILTIYMHLYVGAVAQSAK
jgi:hypothetical protein